MPGCPAFFFIGVRTMPSGHAHQTVELVRKGHKSSPTDPVFTLLHIAVTHDIPFATIADDLGVTKQSIYNWIYGAYSPRDAMTVKIKALVKRLKNHNEKV
jgi:hypothetical protein